MHARDRPTGQATRHDEIEMPEVRGDVDGQPVHRYPARNPDADCADLPVPRSNAILFFTPDPGAGCSGITVRDDAEVPQRVDRPLLKPSQVSMKSQLQRVQVQDGVGHQLARPVVGDVTPSVRFLDHDPGCFKSIGIGQEMVSGPRTM